MKHVKERPEESVLRRTRRAAAAPGTEPASPQGVYAAAAGPQDAATI